MIHAALDTSDGVALAISQDDDMLYNGRLDASGRNSDRQLVPFVIDALAKNGLTPADVTHWSVGTGPGSFAGLRCGIAMLKGFRMVSGAFLRGIPTSCAIAARIADGKKQLIGVLHDGRCNQVLLARVQGDSPANCQLAEMPRPLDPEELLDDGHRCDCYAALADVALPDLPPSIAQRLHLLDAVDAAMMLTASEKLYPWPQSEKEVEQSTAPLYVRQAVFVHPAILRA